MITKSMTGYRIVLELVLVVLICCVAVMSADSIGNVTMKNPQRIIPSKTLNLQDQDVTVIK